MYFGEIAFPRGVNCEKNCYEASVNPEFASTLALRLNQNCFPAVLQSNQITIKFGMPEARRLNCQKLEDMVCTYFHKTIVKLVFESKSEILRSSLVFLTIMATWIVGYKMCTKKHWKPHKILHKLVEKLALNVLTEWMESRYLEILSFWSFRNF